MTNGMNATKSGMNAGNLFFVDNSTLLKTNTVPKEETVFVISTLNFPDS